MRTKHTTQWKQNRKKISLKQACLRALRTGAYYIHFAGHTQQPCVIIPLQKWLNLLEIKHKQNP